MEASPPVRTKKVPTMEESMPTAAIRKGRTSMGSSNSGATAEAARCSAANYVYLTVMERGAAEGYRVFDFGRTRRDNVGGCDFKRFQGFEPRPLEYQICTLAGHTAPNLSPSNPKLRLARRMWSFLPLAVARPLGALLSKHIPG